MAELATKTTVNLKHVSVRSIKGLNEEDVRELEALGVGSMEALVAAMKQHKGDLEKLSTAANVIEPEQSNRIGDALLLDARCPEALKKAYKLSNVPVEEPKDEPLTIKIVRSVPKRGFVRRLFYKQVPVRK